MPRRKRRAPARTIKEREDQVVAQAIDLAERQIQEGTASSQIITHFLKLGTTRERLEQERIERENLLLEGKVESLRSATRIEELYAEAIMAMRQYQGQEELENPEEDYDEEYHDGY